MKETQLSLQNYDQHHSTYTHYQRKIDKIKSNLKKYSADYVSRNESKYAQALNLYEKHESHCSTQLSDTMLFNNSLLPLIMKIMVGNYYEVHDRLASGAFLSKDSFLFQLQEIQNNNIGFLEGGVQNESILIEDLSFSKNSHTVNLN